MSVSDHDRVEGFGASSLPNQAWIP